MASRKAVRRSVPSGELPEFAPVPRKCPRHDGWTVERQKAFIAALADTGCVAIAARMVNMSGEGAYQLRRQPGAESFRRAWEAAQTLGLLPVKDEAFHRAMHGQLVPVFVAGKLMGFRRKKNDRLLMFILRHYGQDAQGRKTTVNYFSTRASASAASLPPPAGGRDGERGSPEAHAAAETSTTTVKTVISGGGGAPTQRAADDQAANILDAFEGVELDAEAQAEIRRTLEACAERRRALEDDPENDPECDFVRVAPGDLRYLGELESGVEGDWVAYKPDGEYSWESLGEGGQAEKVEGVLAGIAERRAAKTPEQLEAEEAEHRAELQRMREARALPPPVPSDQPAPAKAGEGPKPEPDPDDPRFDWRNWSDAGYAPPSESPSPRRGCDPSGGRMHGRGEGESEPSSGSPTPDAPTPKTRKRYKKRTPKPPFTALAPSEGEAAYEARKKQAAAEVESVCRAGAAAEAERRERRKKPS